MAYPTKLARRERPEPHWIAYLISGCCYLLLLLPLLAIVFYSFLTPQDHAEGWELSLAWYRDLFQDDSITDAFWVSLKVATTASLGATFIGVSGALALNNSKFSGSRAITALAALPLALPELVLGLSSLIWFGVLRLGLGMVTVIIGHITFSLAYVVVVVQARLADYDPALNEAAADLGARPLAVLQRVTLPLLGPAIGAGAMMAFTLSFDDFMISFFTTGVDTGTLPVRIYSMIRFGINREIYALSTLLIALSALGMMLSARIRR